MKKYILLSILGFILSSVVWANPPEVRWNRTLWEAHGWCYSLLTVPTGGYVMAGSYQQNETTDFMLVCTDTNGVQQWVRRYGGPNMDQCRHAERTPDGGYILVGYTESYLPGQSGYPAVWMLKTDSNGDSLWSRTYGNGYLTSWSESVQQTFDGGYLIAAARYPDSVDMEMGWLIKTDANGDTMWTRHFPDFMLTSLLQLREGGFLIAGAAINGPSCYRIAVEFLSAYGDSVWYRDYFVGLASSAREMVELENGDILLTGIIDYSGREPDLIVFRLTSNGDSLWQRQVDGLGWDHPADLCLTQDSGCVVVGYTSGPGGVETVPWLTKLSLNGDILWNTTYDLEYTDMASTIRPLSDGGFIMAGWTYDCSPNPCLWISRLNPEVVNAVDPPQAPADFSLAQNYPNPFNAATRIEFSLSREAQTRIEVFDLQGRLVSTLVNSRHPAGTHSVSFDGSRLSSGIYIYRMQAGSFSQSRKFVLLK